MRSPLVSKPFLLIHRCSPAFLAELARRFKDEGMLAYVNLIQKKEKEVGCDVLTHQKWCESTLLLRVWALSNTPMLSVFQERSELHR